MNVRLFVGIDLPNKLKHRLLELQAELQQAGIKGLWKSANSFHLTLEFLGETEGSKVGKIIEALEAPVHRAFVLHVQGIGFFPNHVKPRILWAGVGGEINNLLTLQADMHNTLLQAGLSLESRRYTPHVTLAAKPMPNRADLSSFTNAAIGEFLVDRFSLIESAIIKNKRVYSSIRHFALREN